MKTAFRFLLLPLLVFVTGNLFVYYTLITGRVYFFNAVGVSYLFSTVLFPAFLIGMALLPSMNWKTLRMGRVTKTQYSIILVASLILGLRWYATHHEPHQIVLREVTLRSEKIKNSFAMLHISDIQSARVGSYEEGVFTKIQQIDPDLIIHTGDLLQPVPPATWETEFPKLQGLFDSVTPEFGILNIYGNCEVHRRGFLESHLKGVETLEGNNVLLQIGQTQLRIHGFGFDESLRSVKPTAEKLVDRFGHDEFVVLLGHSPNFILSVLEVPIDLCLAGHTHGGQIRIPGFGPLITFSSMPRKWASGFHEVGETRFNVSAGMGTEGTEWLPPIRFLCPPDMTLFHLLPGDLPAD